MLERITRLPDASRRSLKTTAMIGAVALLMTVGGGVATASAAPCWGPSCVHLNPGGGATSSCSSGTNARSLETVQPPGGGAAVTLRWSNYCSANWAKCCGGPQAGYWNYWVETSDGHREDKAGSNQAQWTWMVNGRLLARACIQGYATSGYSCTRWY